MKKALSPVQFSAADLAAAIAAAPVTVVTKPSKASKANKSAAPVAAAVAAPVAPVAPVAPSKAEQAKAEAEAVRKARASTLGKLNFAILDGFRPTAGSRLFSFTQAWLELTGMMNGAAVDELILKQIVGQTAINYHRKLGNFGRDGLNIVLSAQGLNKFSLRMIDNQVDPVICDAFKVIMETGIMDGNLVKSQAGIKKIVR